MEDEPVVDVSLHGKKYVLNNDKNVAHNIGNFILKCVFVTQEN